MSRTFHTLVAVMLAAPFAAQSQAVPPGTAEIATNGRGEMRVAPDHAILIVSIESRGPAAAAAASDNAAKVTSTTSALRATGLAAEQIATLGYTVSQDYDFSAGGRRPSGFVARNTLRIDVRRISDIGKLIDAALAAGATQISPTQFLPANPDDARARALTLAVASARRDAETMAKAAGGSLGKLIYLSSSYSAQPYYEPQVVGGMADMRAPPAALATTVLTPGDLTVTAVASGRWEFLPALNPGR